MDSKEMFGARGRQLWRPPVAFCKFGEKSLPKCPAVCLCFCPSSSFSLCLCVLSIFLLLLHNFIHVSLFLSNVVHLYLSAYYCKSANFYVFQHIFQCVCLIVFPSSAFSYGCKSEQTVRHSYVISNLYFSFKFFLY